jgi:DNA-binding NtrC family response regulator
MYFFIAKPPWIDYEEIIVHFLRHFKVDMTLELAVEIMATRPDLPIMLLSGAGADVTALLAASPGIREFLAKPISLAELAAVLGRYLPTH